MSSSGSAKLLYEKCLLIWGNASLASFDNQNSQGYMDDRVSRSKSKSLNLNGTWAGLRLMDWTPGIVQFLDSALDACVEENTFTKGLARKFSGNSPVSYLQLFPSATKELIRQTYDLIEAARKNKSKMKKF